MFIIQSAVVVLIATLLHELAHVIAAKMLNLKVNKVGINLKPYPHFYVSANLEQLNYRKRNNMYIFIFAGSACTITLFFILNAFSFFGIEYLYYGLCTQLVIETNPFFSDFSIAISAKLYGNNNFREIPYNQGLLFKKYQFTTYWYLHFIIWTIIILVLFSKNTAPAWIQAH